MDRTVVADVLFRAAEMVLETAALTWVENAEEGCVPEERGRLIAASMGFHGQASGFVAVAVPEELGAVLAANMVGADENQGADAADTLDAVKELLNMVGMIVVESLFGDMGIAVSPPREIGVSDYMDYAAGRPGMEGVRVGIATDESVMELLLFADEGGGGC